MTAERKSFLFRIVFAVVMDMMVTTNSSILKDPSFSPDYFYSTLDQNNFKQTFLDRRRRNRVTAKRVQILDHYLSNNSVFVDGIMHQIIDKKHKQLSQVNEIEKAFRNLIGLKGVKLTYKRDQFWRTWRKVNYPDGDKIVCYRCEVSMNCSSCQNGGYWVIEENPPCPLEILSVISNEEFCAVDITNSTDTEDPCPIVVQFTDFTRMCDNPIDTKWRVQKIYNNDSKRFPAIICGGRDFCVVTTFYLITRNYVSFQIINSTNHILYSRIMKNGKKNYACVADCGIMDSKTKIVSKTDHPLVVDLINNKKKRDDKKQNEASTTFDSDTTQKTLKFYQMSGKLKHAFNEMETAFNYHETRRHHDEKHPSCASLKHHHMENDLSDEI